MAHLKFGPWGGLIGKLGNNVGYIRKGKYVVCPKPRSGNDACIYA